MTASGRKRTLKPNGVCSCALQLLWDLEELKAHCFCCFTGRGITQHISHKYAASSTAFWTRGKGQRLWHSEYGFFFLADSRQVPFDVDVTSTYSQCLHQKTIVSHDLLCLHFIRKGTYKIYEVNDPCKHTSSHASWLWTLASFIHLATIQDCVDHISFILLSDLWLLLLLNVPITVHPDHVQEKSII